MIAMDVATRARVARIWKKLGLDSMEFADLLRRLQR